MAYADIGAAVHMDRTTVSRRMRNIIAPQLEKLLQKTQQSTQQQTQQLIQSIQQLKAGA